MKKRILVMDDQKLICNIIGRILPHKEYKVFKSHDGEEGLNMMYKVAPDLIILDIMMPKLNGYEVVEKIRKDPDYRDIPIIMMSGIIDPRNKIRGFNLGINAFIDKPFDIDELIKKVSELLKKNKKSD